jgi:hypothetical protein
MYANESVRSAPFWFAIIRVSPDKTLLTLPCKRAIAVTRRSNNGSVSGGDADMVRTVRYECAPSYERQCDKTRIDRTFCFRHHTAFCIFFICGVEGSGRVSCPRA